MYKTFLSLFTVLSINAIGYADNQNNPDSEQLYDESGSAREEIVQTNSDPRWYKYREGRQEYLKGGNDYPYKQSQYDSNGSYQNQTSPNSDPRWYKYREGRQEYLKGGSDYPKNQN